MKTLSGISQILFNRFYCIFRTLPCVFCTLSIASSVSAQETDNAMLKYGLNFLKTLPLEYAGIVKKKNS